MNDFCCFCVRNQFELKDCKKNHEGVVKEFFLGFQHEVGATEKYFGEPTVITMHNNFKAFRIVTRNRIDLNEYVDLLRFFVGPDPTEFRTLDFPF